MLINILTVGSPKNKYIKELTDDYIKRVQQYTNVMLKTVRQEPISSESGVVIRKKEAKRLMNFMENCYNVVLDTDGETMSSELFAKFLSMRIMNGIRVVNIIIGGPTGIDISVKQKAEKVLSLSMMTFPHELTMVIIMEQIYRAFTIMHKLPYHK